MTATLLGATERAHDRDHAARSIATVTNSPEPWSELFAGAPERRLRAGASLFARDEPVRSAFLVRTGEIALERVLENGTELTLHVAGAGECVAQASLFTERYHCDGVCRSDATVAVLPRGTVLERLEHDGSLAALATSAREVQALRARVEVLRLRRVADRLDAYIALHGRPEPGGWVRVADWIGVTSPALYRELGRRRRGAP